MEQVTKKRRRPLAIGTLRIRASQHAETALDALRDVAANDNADAKSRVEAARALIDFSVAGKNV